MAELAGLIRKYRGHFVLTRKCKDMLSLRNHGGLYLELFKSYAAQYITLDMGVYPAAIIGDLLIDIIDK